MKLAIVSTVSLTLHSFFTPYAKYFSGLGWEVVGIASGVGDDQEKLRDFDSLIEIPWKRKLLSFGNVRAFFSIRNSLKVSKFDVIHVHTPIAAIITRLAYATLRKKVKSKLIYTAHGFHFHRAKRGSGVASSIFRLVEKLAIKWTHVLVVINKEDFDAALDIAKRSACEVVQVKGVGLDLHQYRLEGILDNEMLEIRSNLRKELNLKDTEKLILVVGELNDNKRPLDSILAFQRLQTKGVKLCFVGDGKLRRELENEVRRLGLGKKVIFLGYRNDVSTLLKLADVLILASIREGLPRSVMEAMASGVPVVATDIRGNRDLLESNAGMLVDPCSPAQLSSAIDIIFSDKKLREEIIAAASYKIERYDISLILEHHRNIFENCLGINRNV